MGGFVDDNLIISERPIRSRGLKHCLLVEFLWDIIIERTYGVYRVQSTEYIQTDRVVATIDNEQAIFSVLLVF